MKTNNLMKQQKPMDIEYPAVVLSNVDPLKVGRLQVKIDALMGDTPIWVYPVHPNGAVCLFWVPVKDDIVRVKFMGDDTQSGVWDSGMPGGTLQQTAFATDYPNVYGIADSSGNRIVVNRASNVIDIISMATVNINAATAVNVTTVTANINASGATNITSPLTTITGNAHITGTLTVDGASTLTGACTFEGKPWLPHAHLCTAPSSPSGGVI